LEEEFVAVDNVNSLQRFDQAIPGQNYTVHEILNDVSFFRKKRMKNK